MEQGVLAFLDRDKSKIYAYEIELQIFAPTRNNATLPSLLGRDILNQWRVVIDFPRRIFECMPRTWSFRINSKP